ncbi:MAG: polysaccharide biosynthesis protein [Clostridia bacterium]|nr:polysaccharide biosynthesis protein [Clostridia bacterium]
MAKLTIKKQSYIKGAAILSAGGFVSKILGALYRIPLTNILGGEGIGVYQMVFPLYCILLTVAASGIPAGIARLVSSGCGEGAEKSAFRLYGAIGLIGSILLYLAAKPLSLLQGETAVELCCKMLSPAVFFVSMMSVVRGYFQGRGNMLPTAATEISEQLIKVIFGCVLACLNRNNLASAVASTLAAVTISEALSAVLAFIFYRKEDAVKPLYRQRQASYKSILAYTIPLTFTAMALPLSQLAESILAVNLLRRAGQNATALYGIFSGCAVTIVNLPVSVTYGLAAASVPHISPEAARGKMSSAKLKAVKCLFLTLAVAAPAAVGLYIFAPLAAKIIFRSLDKSQTDLLIRLVRVMAVNAVTLSLAQTSSACLTSLGSPVKAAISQWFTAILRVALAAMLIKFTSLSITSLAIAADCSYLVAVLLNIWYIIRAKQKAGGVYENNVGRSRIKRRRSERQGD